MLSLRVSARCMKPAASHKMIKLTRVLPQNHISRHSSICLKSHQTFIVQSRTVSHSSQISLAHHLRKCYSTSVAAKDIDNLQNELTETIDNSSKAQSLDIILGKHRSVDQLLNWYTSCREQLVPWKCAKILDKLVMLLKRERLAMGAIEGQNIKDITKDERFSDLCKSIGNLQTQPSTDNKKLFSILSSLLVISEKDLPVIMQMEKEILNKLDKFSMGDLIEIVGIHNNHLHTELRKSVFQFALKLIELRWSEIENPKHVVSLMYAKEIPDNFQKRLEEKAEELCEQMSPMNLYKIIYLLAVKKQRNLPLLKTASFHLAQGALFLNTTGLVNLWFAFASFNFVYPSLLEEMSVDVTNQAAELSLPANVFPCLSIIHSVSQLKWDKLEMVDLLCKSVVSNIDNKVWPANLASMLMTCATLNHMPQNVADNLSDIVRRCVGLKKRNKRLWLDVVWSLAVMNKLDASLAESVLSQEFHSSFVQNDGKLEIPVLLKLLNISAAAQYDLEGYSGSLFQFEDNFKKDYKFPMKMKQPLYEAVMGTLKKIAPVGKYWRTRQPTSHGYLIDVELVIDGKGEPQLLEKFESGEMEAGFKRVALMLLEPSDITRVGRSPVGLHSMATRHLAAAGYCVVQVPFDDFYKEGKEAAKKVTYITTKLRAVSEN